MLIQVVLVIVLVVMVLVVINELSLWLYYDDITVNIIFGNGIIIRMLCVLEA